MHHVLALLLSAAPHPALPPISLRDLDRFPPRAVVACHRESARRNLELLRLRQCIDQREQVSLAVDEAQFSFVCWDTLQTAGRHRWTDLERTLAALAGLRHLLKRGAFYGGWMPPLRGRCWAEDDSIPCVRGPAQ